MGAEFKNVFLTPSSEPTNGFAMIYNLQFVGMFVRGFVLAEITVTSVYVPDAYTGVDPAFLEIIAPYAQHPAAQQMNCYIQHGTTTTL
ncbi:MAG: hypothetical protein IKE43_11310 [Coriobacteriales bacterium]|nr:hypothetical protein [Coriobacteriales bacterium]